MSSSESAISPPKKFYGWYVLAAGFIILFFNTGARLSFGVMFKPMMAEFDWDRATLSSAFLLHMGVYALSLVVTGKLYDRYGPQRVIILSTIFSPSATPSRPGLRPCGNFGFTTAFSLQSAWGERRCRSSPPS